MDLGKLDNCMDLLTIINILKPKERITAQEARAELEEKFPELTQKEINLVYGCWSFSN